ncbi:MAG: DUF2326 domain-containing protein [Wohlfahrtiimonas sp.]
MKLIRFILEIDGIEKRNITFKDGLNIITNKKENNVSGNSVGKSTLGRVLDYLFDGSISPIYIDEEFKTTKQEIEHLFSNHEVYATLEYIGLDGKLSTIKRRLSNEEEKRCYILNGLTVAENEYVRHIMGSIFNVFSVKPTIRKLAPKFLRTNQYRMTKTVKFDESKSFTNSDMSTVFLYLFNFNDTEILSTIHKLKTEINRYKKNLKAFNSVISQDKIISSVSKLQRDISKLEKSLLSSEQGGNKIEIIGKINDIDNEQNKLSEEILALELHIKNIINTNEMLKVNDQRYLLDELSTIYEYASVKIESTLKDYEQSLIFHDYLVNTKKEFVSEDLDKLQKACEESNGKFTSLEIKKYGLYEELKSKKNIEELSSTVKEIGRLDKELASLTAIISKKDDLNSKLDEKKQTLMNLSASLDVELKNVTLFEQKFIENFKVYTKSFYGTPYSFSLHFNNENGECMPEVDDVQSNNEGGLKRLEVVTFDLAYIKTVSDERALRPNFVLHDSIDEIDIQHIREIFNISMKLSGQHFVSLLTDKLSLEDYDKYKDRIILELSQDDKFFRV